MRITVAIVMLPIALIVAAADLQAADSPRRRESIDSDWKFTRGNPDNASAVQFDDSQWQSVDLPHDWSIDGPFDTKAESGRSGAYLPTGIGSYRKHLKIPASDKGKQISLEFDGVYEYSEVWINGHALGMRPYGFISFSYDITPYVDFDGDNTIAVKVDNSRQTNCRWYSGSGIYRDVWLSVTDDLRVPQWGAFVTTPQVSADSATIHVAVQLDNRRPDAAEYECVCTLLGSDGKQLQSTTLPGKIDAGANTEVAFDLTIDHPNRWSPDDPRLYTARIELTSGGQLVDRYDTTFGIRSLEFDVNRGFLLNSRHTKFNGVCLHGDGGAVGVAVPKEVWRRRLVELKEMGCNAIRTSHNPPDPDFLNLCDELGFLVMDEAFDEWKAAKGQVKNGYHTLFDEWHVRDVTDFVLRDRNHPSVVLWSAGNEIPDQTSPQGPATAAELVGLFHQLDPTRPVTAGCDNVYAEPRSASPKFMAALDIAGYNYVDRWRNRAYLYFQIDREAFPQRKFIGTEDASMSGPRGNYGNPFRPEDAPNAQPPAPSPATSPAPAPGLGRRRFTLTPRVAVEQLWRVVAENDYVEGDFMWTGIDYLGEAGVGAFSGVIDSAGFKKDGYYFYQSQWTTKPMLHVFPHWNWKGHEGGILPVYCYTNCDSVELFVNGKSYGTKGYGLMLEGMRDRYGTLTNPGRIRTTSDLHLQWDVAYEPGTLRVVGKRAGQVVATEEVNTTGEPADIALQLDKATLSADGRDVAHLTVSIVDDQGRTVPTAGNRLKFDVAGPAKLIGVDSGNMSIDEPFKADQRTATSGLALAILQSTSAPGVVTVTVTSDGLPERSINLECR